MSKKPKKIEENYSYKEMDYTLRGFKALRKVYNVASIFGFKSQSMEQNFRKLEAVEKQYIQLRNTPDKFNEFYSELGWIAYDSMNFEIMVQATQLAEDGQIEAGEQLLVDYYNEEHLRFLISRLKGIQEYRPRTDLTYKALDDYLKQRYYACVPVILMMIDGFVNDFEQKGFFAAEIDLSVWDTIAAHDSGLNQLASILGKSRKRTTTEEIYLPYRNGILHGRDLGYDNKKVAAKTWATLFAIGDWARAIKSGKKDLKKEFSPPTFSENIATLRDSLKKHDQVQKDKKEIEKWHPRNIKLGIDIPETGVSGDYPECSPEKTVVEFLAYLAKSNYGKMALLTTKLYPGADSDRKIPKQVREIFCETELEGFKIVNIRDEAPAISEVDVILILQISNSILNCQHTFRLIYQDENCDPLVRGNIKGAWKILWNLDRIKYAVLQQ